MCMTTFIYLYVRNLFYVGPLSSTTLYLALDRRPTIIFDDTRECVGGVGLVFVLGGVGPWPVCVVGWCVGCGIYE